MATETAEEGEGEGWDSHLRGLTVTTFASLLGLAAGVASSALASGPPVQQANDRIGLYLVAGAILVQIPVYAVIGIDVEDFGAKEYLYIGFMTFSMWFITWGILLTTGASI